MTEETTTSTPTEPVADVSAAKTEKPAENKSGGDNDRGQRRGGRGRRDNNRRKEPKEFEESIIQIDRVTRVTKGGRQLRFRVSIVIGDGKGRVGFGVGKSSEVMLGVQKAIADAKRNLIKVPIFEDTIPHEVSIKFKSTKVLLFPAPEGKGVIAGGSVRKVLELAGIKNIQSKMHGSRNGLNSAQATIQALKALHNRAPHKPASAQTEAVAQEAVPKEEAKAPKKPAAKKTTKKTDQ